jgi:hypothetical protein
VPTVERIDIFRNFYIVKHVIKSEALSDILLRACFFTVMRSGSPTPKPQAGESHIAAARDCLFIIIAATLHTWRPLPTFVK